MLAKKKSSPPTPSLFERIEQVRSDIEAYIDGKVQTLATSRDSRGIPVQALRHMLVRGESCACKAALHVMEQEGDV